MTKSEAVVKWLMYWFECPLEEQAPFELEDYRATMIMAGLMNEQFELLPEAIAINEKVPDAD